MRKVFIRVCGSHKNIIYINKCKLESLQDTIHESQKLSSISQSEARRSHDCCFRHIIWMKLYLVIPMDQIDLTTKSCPGQPTRGEILMVRDWVSVWDRAESELPVVTARLPFAFCLRCHMKQGSSFSSERANDSQVLQGGRTPFWRLSASPETSLDRVTPGRNSVKYAVS